MNRRILLPSLALLLLFAFVPTGCSDSDPLQKIRTLQDQRRYAATVQPLRELLAVQPSDPETNFLYGRALVNTRNAELALFSLREAMLDPEWKVRAGLEVGTACLITGDYNQAIEATTEILEDDPENIEALLLRAQARAHWRNDPTLALEDAERVLELDPERVEAYEPLILSLLALDQPLEARERLAEAGSIVAESDAPDRVLAWHCTTTATLSLDMGETEKAEEQFDACVRRFPGEREIVVKSVDIFDTKGDPDRSLEILREAVAADPDSRAFRTSLATRLVGLGEIEEAESLMLAATEGDDPESISQAWSDLGDFYNITQDYQKAAEAFGNAYEKLERDDAELAFRYADSLIFAERFDDALEQAAKLSLDSHRALIEARVAQVRGDHEKALEGFQRASQLWPNNAAARYYAGYSAEQLGRFGQAVEEYRYSIRIDSGATGARQRVASILLAQGNPMGAYNMLFVQAIDHPLDPEGWILGAELIARVSNASQLQDHLLQLSQRFPLAYPKALIRAADGLDQNGLPDGGVELLFQPPYIDWSSKAAFPIVEKLVRLAHKAQRIDRAQDFLTKFREVAPNQKAALAEAEAILFELEGKPEDQVRARWLAVRDLDPSRTGPWIALGRHFLEKEPAKALEHFDQALQIDASRRDVALDRARALLALDRSDEATKRLEQLLVDDPKDVRAAALRVEIDMARGRASDQTLEWARRALRFGRQPQDFERLASVFRAMGNEDEAIATEEAGARARETAAAAEAEAKASQPAEQS